MPPKRKSQVLDVHERDFGSNPSSAKTPSPLADSSYGTSTVLAGPSLKKRRTTRGKGKNADGVTPEKRAARFRNSPPQAIMERIDRVMSQRFFMVDRRRNGEDLREEFSVLGSTGNVYTVIIDKLPSCNCPDAQRGNHCKHILFVYLKVLHVPSSSHTWYQKALVTSELTEIFANAPPSPSSAAPASVRAAFAKASGREVPGASDDADASSRKRMPGSDDDCPVCYEGMHGNTESKLVWCEGCGNALHKECFQQWARSATKLTCVYCRRPWSAPGTGKGGSNISRGGYINLAAVAGLSPRRDTSSYYYGPRRGERSWYSERHYEDEDYFE